MHPAIILAVLVCLPAMAFSTTIIVPDDYATIQAAIDAAVDGDTVLVKPGTYVENIDFKGKAIILTSVKGAAATAIDGNQAGSVVTCQSGEDDGSLLDGFTIKNGTGKVSGGVHYGGGMYIDNNSSPTIQGCVFSKNWAFWGGGLYCETSNPTVVNCTFTENTASYSCGGMYNQESDSVVVNCVFAGNTADLDSGGMHNEYGCSPTVTNCLFIGNQSKRDGGGMANAWQCDTTVINCMFIGNNTNSGGGMANLGSNPTVINCTFTGNWSINDGGGMTNKYNSKPKVTNCILWGDAPVEIFNGGSTPSVTYSCVENGYPGTGNIDSDPLFVNLVQGDCHLTFPSPCKDTGDNAALSAPMDFEGDPRIAYGTADMGADEFYTHLYYTGDAAPGGSVAVKFIGDPDSDPVGLVIGTYLFDPPLPSTYGDWYIAKPWILLTGLPSIPSEGVYVLSGTIPPSIPTPVSIYLQALIEDELTNLCTMEVE